MRRKTSFLINTVIILTALIAALFIGGVASAISYGQLDGDTHPYVGVVVINKSSFASGVLISPTVFLTAGHVTEMADTADTVEVSFDSTPGPSTVFIEASEVYTYPD